LEKECPTIDGFGLTVHGPKGGKVIEWAARLDGYAQSVDLRVKIPGWMAEFEKWGGKLVVKEADMDDLEHLTESHDLVIMASGKGAISDLFERDPEKSRFDQLMRALAATYVRNMRPRPEFSAVCFNLIPGVGEYFVFPALTTSGPCEIMTFEGIPGGPMDCWDDIKTLAEHIAKSKWILETFLSWEAERCKYIELTDDNGVFTGRYAPIVRKPIGTLRSGRTVLGMADAVVLNDPLTLQGANNAARCAELYLRSIRDRDERAFHAQWMQQTFDRYWRGYGQMGDPMDQYHAPAAASACAEDPEQRTTHGFGGGCIYQWRRRSPHSLPMVL
jgi:hypothetical protein